MNYIQRIYDLLVEAQINEVAVYRNTSINPSIHSALQTKQDGQSEYGIKNTKGQLMNIKDPQVVASAERGAQIRQQKGLAPLPSLRDRARLMMNKRIKSGQAEVRAKGLGSDNQLHSYKSKGHVDRR